MRPSVNCIQSPCYKVAKIAAEFLKENFRFETRHNIRNNLEVIEDSNQLKIKSDDKMISLHVTNIFGETLKEPLLELLPFNNYHGHPEGLKYAR